MAPYSCIFEGLVSRAKVVSDTTGRRRTIFACSDAIEKYIDGVSECTSTEETYVGCGQAHTTGRGLEYVLLSKGP